MDWRKLNLFGDGAKFILSSKIMISHAYFLQWDHGLIRRKFLHKLIKYKMTKHDDLPQFTRCVIIEQKGLWNERRIPARPQSAYERQLCPIRRHPSNFRVCINRYTHTPMERNRCSTRRGPYSRNTSPHETVEMIRSCCNNDGTAWNKILPTISCIY